MKRTESSSSSTERFQLIVARQRRTFHLRVSEVVSVLLEVNKDRHVVLNQLRRQTDESSGLTEPSVQTSIVSLSNSVF